MATVGVSIKVTVFLPRDATQSAVLLRQVVSLSVTLKYRYHVDWNSFENNLMTG